MVYNNLVCYNLVCNNLVCYNLVCDNLMCYNLACYKSRNEHNSVDSQFYSRLTSSAEWTMGMIHLFSYTNLPGGEKPPMHSPFLREDMVHLFSLGTSSGRKGRKVKYILNPIWPVKSLQFPAQKPIGRLSNKVGCCQVKF